MKLNNGDLIEIIYLDRTGALTQRRIRIIEITAHYIKAYCCRRHQVRVFSRDNILGMKIEVRRAK